MKFKRILALFLILIWKNAISQIEPLPSDPGKDQVTDSARHIAGYVMLEKELEFRIKKELGTLDSIKAVVDTLEARNEKIYSELLTLEGKVQEKMNEAYLHRQNLVDALIMYEFQKSHYETLLKKYFKLMNHRKPEKIIIIKKKIILQDQDKKMFGALIVSAIAFGLVSFGISKALGQ